ncbi:MAG: hypothetical protein Q8K83_02790 [Methylotenera sp.]|nr:hypothetical protein [Methylotenera sp.]
MMGIIRATYKVLMPIFIGLFIGASATQAQAEANEQLGRLFSKPNERSNLNVIRQNQKLKVINAQEAQQPEVILNAEPVELPEPITLQGYVKRNDGQKNTLWINGRTVQEDSKIDNVKIGRLNQRGFSKKGASTEGVDIKIPANGKHIRLKAGQMYEPENNQIYEMQVVEKAKRLSLETSGTVDDYAE